MPRYAAIIEYDGTSFAGFQRQQNLLTVQGAIEVVLKILEPDFTSLSGAGRTDSGVHAAGQVIHFDLHKSWNTFTLTKALNGNLTGHPIAFVKIVQVDEAFHARFSAIKRTYLYRLVSRPEPLVFERSHAWQVSFKLDLEAMQAGATYLLGQHDFTTFRSTHCQAVSPIKTLDAINIQKRPYPHGYEFRFTIEAKSFLHKQIRSIVGTLVRVGVGKWAPKDVKTALMKRNREACGPLAKPHGLYLQRVDYNPDPFSGSS